MWTVLQKIKAEEGGRALYRGVTPSMLGVMVYAGTSFFTYETLKVIYSFTLSTLLIVYQTCFSNIWNKHAIFTNINKLWIFLFIYFIYQYCHVFNFRNRPSIAREAETGALSLSSGCWRGLSPASSARPPAIPWILSGIFKWQGLEKQKCQMKALFEFSRSELWLKKEKKYNQY